MFVLTPEALDAILSLALGLAFAGLLASGFELVTARRASFRLLETGDMKALASVPVVVFSAPFIILRNALKAECAAGRPFLFAMMATVAACFWGMMCGRLFLDFVLRALV
ncbi:MAG: hypothetical protein BGP06_08145 [Rhizobiales bacterium 65-9]|nr:hypothetical protein [Hyphomicrobiales bacterium]OJY33823.1 MAG: hypothetical protein BGP06_08145 [Rhizobiales bacterium 65-9]